MTHQEKQIDSFTDLGDKKLREKIFERLFETLEITKLSPEGKEQYEESLKSYRDLKNAIDTSFDEGKIAGKIEGKIEYIIRFLKRGKLTIAEIAEDFGTTIDFVEQIKREHNL
jgi:predicted transposase YdaD